MPAGADPARPRSELGAALANDSSRHVLPDDIHAHLRLQRMDPSPAFHAGTGFQSSATHKPPATFPSYLPGFAGSAPQPPPLPACTPPPACIPPPVLNPPKPASAPPPARATWADISERPKEELPTLLPRFNKGKGKGKCQDEKKPKGNNKGFGKGYGNGKGCSKGKWNWSHWH